MRTRCSRRGRSSSVSEEHCRQREIWRGSWNGRRPFKFRGRGGFSSRGSRFLLLSTSSPRLSTKTSVSFPSLSSFLFFFSLVFSGVICNCYVEILGKEFHIGIIGFVLFMRFNLDCLEYSPIQCTSVGRRLFWLPIIRRKKLSYERTFYVNQLIIDVYICRCCVTMSWGYLFRFCFLQFDMEFLNIQQSLFSKLHFRIVCVHVSCPFCFPLMSYTALCDADIIWSSYINLASQRSMLYRIFSIKRGLT